MYQINFYICDGKTVQMWIFVERFHTFPQQMIMGKMGG